jgi:hypothetical protein
MNLELFSSEVEPGREAAFLVLLAFLASFLFIRTSARLMRSPKVTWWPGSVEAGGVHLHHLVWGISLILISGFVAFASDLDSPWWQITATAFGIGAGLTLDEFALWVYLRDVYWSSEGRDSIDAVIVAALLAGLVVLGAQPLGWDDTGSAFGAAAGALVALALAVVTFAKGRIMLGALALFVLPVGVYGALRLAKPGSPWARKWYGANKLARARARYRGDRPLEVLGTRLRNAIGGAPSESEKIGRVE